MTTTPVVAYSFSAWTGMFPEFENVSPTQGQVYFTIATTSIISNDATNPAANDGNMPTLVYLATSHVAWLWSSKDAQGNPSSSANAQPASQIVGRISNASEGSVSVQADLQLGSNPSAQEVYLSQTKYGLALWAALAPYRTAQYAARPTTVFAGRFGRRAWWGGGGLT